MICSRSWRTSHRSVRRRRRSGTSAARFAQKTLSLESVASSVSTRKFGLLQQRTSARAEASVVARARTMVAALTREGGPHKAQLELLETSLKAKKVDFSKVLAMIDGMVSVLKEEQSDDDSTKAFCDKDLEKSAAEKKDTEEAIAASEAFIEETTAESAATADEIKELQKEIKQLDKAVAEATEQRKEEHADFLVFQQQSNAALQLIDKAKNRLFKFYRPTMYKEAPTEEEKILAASGRSDMIATAAPEFIAGTTQTVFAQVSSSADAAPPPPPATWDAYQKKEGKSNGVMALMDMLVKELQDGITESEHEEETAQKDYERLMSDSQASREKMVESITAKEAAKAELDTSIVATKDKKTSQEADLANVKQYLVELHAKCDFIVENYDMRKAARE